MKKATVLFVIVFTVHTLYGQEKKMKISDKLELIQLSPETYVHTSEGSNGMVTINNSEGVIVSTPPSDEATIQLINWMHDSLKVKIIGAIIDSWHPDNMEGLDVVHNYGIKSYSNELTRQIAIEKGLPVPLIGFDQKMMLNVGNKKLVLQYFGPAHTTDGIMVWIPEEKILFGNNGVRNFNGWVGNIGDANVNAWSETIAKAKTEFGSAKYVIPGHGQHGGPELLDYTINLYKPGNWGVLLKIHNVKPSPIFNNYGKVFVSAMKDSTSGNLHYFKDALVFVAKGEQYLMIESPSIKYKSDSQSILSNFGRIRILNKKQNSTLPETDGYYKKLMVDFRDDAIGMTIILKEFTQ